MNTTTKTLALAVGGAFALSIAATTVHAAENPFAAKSLSSGYMVADADTKMKDGKCSANKKKAAQATESKTADGSCSAEKKAKDGSCHANAAKADAATK